jgi:hypothetical protein
MGDDLFRKLVVHRDRDQPGPHNRHIGCEILGPVLGDEGDPRARLEPQPPKRARRGSDRLFKLADADGALLPSRPQLDDDRIERGRSLVEKVGEVASAAHETRPYPAVVP